MAAIALLAAFVLTSIGAPPTALATDMTPAMEHGVDISFPQCASGIPAPAAQQSFAVIGVTGGKAFTHNPCFAAQYDWAVQHGFDTALYLNLNSPKGPTASRGNAGPLGTCQPSDSSCVAFNYGYNSAQDAFDYAQSEQATSGQWWLDVETANYWSPNTTLNARVIAGAIKFFDDHRLAVGIYSVATMWRQIAGGYAPGLPIWVAQSNKKVPTMNYCSAAYAFAGGVASMVQSRSGSVDLNYPCPAADGASQKIALIKGSASTPISLVTSETAILAASPGGTARYYIFGNPSRGSQQTVTLDFWPHGPDVANGLFVSLYQKSVQLAKVHAIDATTPGQVTLTFSSASDEPFVLQLMNYNDSRATQIEYVVRRN
jgi:hypothetical protein